ncbi:MAG TPA: ankyrin repeat domain-containing protein [Candidatus Binatia bacterium]|nr:ankyrin repeat domain-containing protein [Candidatus Binatia bacterium]
MKCVPFARCAVAIATVTLVLVPTRAGHAQETPPAQPPAGSIVPKPEALAPKAFTLEERYLDAARRGDLDMLKLCLDKGVDPRAKDGFARSALLLAVLNARNLEMVKFLQARGLPIDEPDVRGRTPLGYAAGNGQLEMVSYLLEQGAAADRKDGQGQTPLYHAVLIGSKETALRLLAAGADVDSRDQFGDTPLMGACNKGFDELARVLIEKGADPALKDQEGRTARERAPAGASFCRNLPATKPGI